MPPSPPIQQQQQEVTATLTSSRASNLIQDIISEEPSPPYTPYPSPGEQSLLFGPQRPWETTINPQSTHQQQSYLSSVLNSSTYYPQSTHNTAQQQQYPTYQHQYHQQPTTASASLSNYLSTYLRYPAGYICAKCHNTGFKRPGKPCRKCWDLFLLPAFHLYNTNNSSSNYYGHATNQQQQQQQHHQQQQQHQHQHHHPAQNYLPLNHSSNISSSGSAYNITGGNVMFAKPGDAALGGWLCTNCRGSGQTQSLMGGGLCSRCRGVGRLFQ